MGLILKVTSGPLEGRTFKIYAGIVIGRVDSEISINDPKISGRHVKIETGAAGDLYFVDLGSRNGISVKNNRETRVKVTPGLAFRLGKTDFLVVELAEPKVAESLEETTLPPVPPVPPVPSAPHATPTNPAPKEPTWQDYFSGFFIKSMDKIVSRPKELHPFKPLLEFSFIGGLQTGTRWSLGYGPRFVGPGSMDLIIYEDNLPDLLFEIKQTGLSFTISALADTPIRVNDKVVSSETIKSGDVISFANTKIKVSLIE